MSQFVNNFWRRFFCRDSYKQTEAQFAGVLTGRSIRQPNGPAEREFRESNCCAQVVATAAMVWRNCTPPPQNVNTPPSLPAAAPNHWRETPSPPPLVLRRSRACGSCSNIRRSTSRRDGEARASWRTTGVEEREVSFYEWYEKLEQNNIIHTTSIHHRLGRVRSKGKRKLALKCLVMQSCIFDSDSLDEYYCWLLFFYD